MRAMQMMPAAKPLPDAGYETPTSEVHLDLPEWAKCTPSSHMQLAGRRLSDEAARTMASQLALSDMLEVLELARGLSVRTTSFVGRIQLGNLHLTVQPKLHGLPLLNLVRYAYGLRNLRLFAHLDQGVEASPFQDLLISQLAVESEELIGRGLHRRYEQRDELLASPRGRIDFGWLARQGALAEAALPCSHYPRLQDTLVNQVLLAGLRLGARLTSDLGLRVQLRRLAALMADQVSDVRLDGHILSRLARETDRLIAAYRPALAIIEILMNGEGVSLDPAHPTQRLPGFLFDMNRFFQALVSRFLHEYLQGHTVQDEYRLRGMLAYDPEQNPKHRKSPEPRPDFVVLRDGHVVAMLDTKYRDLWEETLPREMLYQLVIYAMSRGQGGTAAIIYPTLDATARQASIEVRDPLYGTGRGRVLLRPLNMLYLEKLVCLPAGALRDRVRAALAKDMVFGT